MQGTQEGRREGQAGLRGGTCRIRPGQEIRHIPGEAELAETHKAQAVEKRNDQLNSIQ